MDNLKEFFEELKNRLTSPLIGSFIISWLFYNWYITITLIFYSQTDLMLDGHKSYRDVILSSTDICYNFVYPLLTAVAYTFGFPFIRAAIKEYQTRINVKAEDRIIDITSQAKGYLGEITKRDTTIGALQERLDLANEKITNFSDERTRNLAEIQRGIDELDKAKNNMFSYEKSYDKNNEQNDKRFFSGRWKASYNVGRLEGIWSFSEAGDISVNETPKFRILNLISYESRMWVELIDIENQSIRPLMLRLEISPSKAGSISGTDQNGIEITMQRQELRWQDV